MVLMGAGAVLVALEGTWGWNIHGHWAFVVFCLVGMLATGFAAFSDIKRKAYTSFMSHLGFFLVLGAGVMGAPDRIENNVRLYPDTPVDNITLTDFEVEYYSDLSSPRQFTSTLLIDGEQYRTSVNHPCRWKGYRIYQAGYDSDALSFSVLKLVRDPWLPLAALGAVLMALSGVMSLGKVWKSWKVLLAVGALAVGFGVLSVARIKFGTLTPALRSAWFVPHLGVYMIAYALMALAVVAGGVSRFSTRVPEGLSRRLLESSSALLLVGMVCGAFWAQQAWGNYWTWDAKECWAAVTWLLALCAEHIPSKKKSLVFTILAFLAIQITWYGVNYLPASNNSLHTYNQEQSPQIQGART